MKQKLAIYSGTFDPITYGHIDLIERAASFFDGLIIAVADSLPKEPLFTLSERIDFIRKIFGSHASIMVEGFSGLLVDYAKQKGIHIILRGLRVISDFDYEFRMANVNRVLCPELETFFLVPADTYTYISSSLVREIASFHGDVSKFVPPFVEEALKRKFE